MKNILLRRIAKELSKQEQQQRSMALKRGLELKKQRKLNKSASK